MTLAVGLLAACAGAWLAHLVRLPGGLMIGATFGTAATTLALDGRPLPDRLTVIVFVAVGVLLGLLVNRRTLRALRPVLLPAVACGVGLIIVGIATALLLRALGIAPDGDVLATSPGALSVLSAAAADAGLDAPTVALFHLTRLILILVTIPLLLRLLPDAPAPARVDDGSFDTAAPSRPVLAARWAMVVAGAAVGAALASVVGLGGALIFGATIGTAAVAVSLPRPLVTPAWFGTAVQVGVGWMIGSLVTLESIAAMRTAIVPAVLSAVIGIAAGIGLAYAMRAVGVRLAGDVLATSPGALESLSVIAVERRAGAVQVAVFHTLRVLLVLLSLPVLLTLVPALR